MPWLFICARFGGSVRAFSPVMSEFGEVIDAGKGEITDPDGSLSVS